MNNNIWPYNNFVDPSTYSSKTDWPKISIVTPSYNQGQFIEETILSVLNQNYPNLEYIIIDGGSKDNTVEIIKKYEDKITYWVSEPDNGQADAINKGIKKCTGKIFNWINSDDLLMPSALLEIAKIYKPGYHIAGKVFNRYDNAPKLNDYTQNKNLSLSAFIRLESIYHQPGFWCEFESIKNILLQTSYHYYFDKEFMLNILLLNEQIFYTEKVLTLFRVHDNSKTSTIQNRSSKELLNIFALFYIQNKNSSINAELNTSIKYIIKPLYYISEFKIKNNDSNVPKRLLNFFITSFYYPRLLIVRGWYTLFKNFVLKNGFQ